MDISRENPFMRNLLYNYYEDFQRGHRWERSGGKRGKKPNPFRLASDPDPQKLINIQIFASMHFLSPKKLSSARIFSSDLVNTSWQQHL